MFEPSLLVSGAVGVADAMDRRMLECKSRFMVSPDRIRSIQIVGRTHPNDVEAADR